MKKPIIPILLFYLAGILYGRYMPLYLINLTVFIILILTVRLICSMVSSKVCSKLPTAYSLLPTFILAGAVAINYQSITIPDNHISNFISDDKVSIEGILYKSPEVLENRTRLYVEVRRIKDNEGETYRDTMGKARITLYRDITDAYYKDKIRIKEVRLRIPRNFKNPGGFDYRRFLEDHGIYVTGSISKANQIEILERGKDSLFSSIYKSKERILLFTENNAPSEESAILKTMVFGERGATSKETRNIFSSTGIAHLLAVSGLHMGFVAFASFFIFKKTFSFIFLNFHLRFFLIGAAQRFASFFTIFPVLYYSLLVGGSPSAVRATIMIIVYLLSLVIYRESNIYNTLSLAALIILIWHPPSLFNIGFQLSFMAVLSIVYGFSILNQVQGQDNFKPSPLSPPVAIAPDLIRGSLQTFFLKHRWLYNYILSSVFATIGTLPIIAYHFNLISIVGVIVNIFAIPLASLVVPLTLFFSILSTINGQIASLLMNIPVFLTTFLVDIARLFTHLPYYSIRIQTPSVLTIFMIYPLLFGILNFKRHKWIKIGTVSVCIFLIGFWILTSNLKLRTPNSLKLTFIDVGQGESSLIEFPNGKTMLIDGGSMMGDFDMGGSVVAPYLWDTGITKIDYVIGSHADSDHVGGLVFILKEMVVKNYYDNGQDSLDLSLSTLHEIAAEKNIPWTVLQAGDEIKIDERAKVEILHPPKNYELRIMNYDFKTEKRKSKTQNYKGGHDNNLSIVMKITYGKFSVLFTGDIEKEAERFLIEKQKSSLKSTVVKAPHHGSNSSSTGEFINAVNPEVAIFSVGYKNPFRHPNKKVLERYREKRVKIYRTDRDGLIEIESDGENYTIRVYNQPG
ncbi:MAG: DNA internalization-related competence protein ComEC/Rec2 [Nitrospinae bacterium RIFCSPLOWO2_02_39_17]|nr:MAG: DNA internalization-related competence protein ComEC/Rec2 [Nitrospinae bacterium RIFCSPHIGHO2_12_FULL_39_42]OGW02481.1 MAG: DNA internalization-related competence protein ComEC/Rec2 [Nitrospinae bacterium RIFCSPLOWO2_02_39_17]OGW11968.1 MAG: DNA internalization-related competence protein ComEC/Rec2 [Nitrospinae bacterium RIFCSPLOWO2_12_39_15]